MNAKKIGNDSKISRMIAILEWELLSAQKMKQNKEKAIKPGVKIYSLFKESFVEKHISLWKAMLLIADT